MVINLALSLASHALRKYGRVEIISSTLSSFCFSLLGMKLSRLQSSELAVFAPIYDKMSFLFCSDKTLPPGLRVASAGCQIVGSQYSSLFSGLRSIEVSPNLLLRKKLIC
jgi:hypothetical protein